MSGPIHHTKSMSDASSTDLEEGFEHRYVPRPRPAADANAPASTPRSAQDPPVSFCSRLKCIVFGGFLAVGLVVGLSLILTGRPNPVDYFVPVDPPGKTEASRWDAIAGLTLTVENACTEDWTPFFRNSISEWNRTDALNLRTTRVAVDPECSPRNGRLKVCNSDYGDTPWHGINVVLLDRIKGTIVHSTSKLNDRYMEDDFDRTYLMCHENGHGFGLPHTDEDHLNRDRGDCMDYTIRPRNNQVPGDFNLNLLVELYGTPANPLPYDPALPPPQQPVGSTGTTGTTGNGPPPRPPVNNNGNNNQNDKEKEKDKKEKEEDRRNLQQGTDFDDVDIIASERELVRSCDEHVCVSDYNDQYRIIVSQLLRHV